MKNLKLIIFLTAATFVFLTSCSSQQQEEVDLGSKIIFSVEGKEEVVFDDALHSPIIPADFNPVKVGQTQVLQGDDNSKITIMVDRYGNKTEIRAFPGNSRLSSILLQTSPNGNQEAFVYSQSGEAKLLPKEFLERAMTAPADELANAAKIYQTFKDNQIPYRQKAPTAPLKPLLSSEFTAQLQPIESPPVGESEPETAGQTLTAEKRETISSASKPEDEQQ